MYYAKRYSSMKVVTKGQKKGEKVKHFDCNYCKKSYQGPSTGTILKHLRAAHKPKCLDLLPTPSGQPVRTFFDKKMPTTAFNADIFMGKLLKWIVKTELWKTVILEILGLGQLQL